jgi:hypothetical protein
VVAKKEIGVSSCSFQIKTRIKDHKIVVWEQVFQKRGFAHLSSTTYHRDRKKLRQSNEPFRLKSIFVHACILMLPSSICKDSVGDSIEGKASVTVLPTLTAGELCWTG